LDKKSGGNGSGGDGTAEEGWMKEKEGQGREW